MTLDLLPPIYAIFLYGFLGAAFGSFVTLVSHRIIYGDNITTKRSRCPACSHILGIFDLIPILSWVLLRGRCRYCHSKIAMRYPLIELSLALMFIVIYCIKGHSLESYLIMATTIALMVMIVTDFEHYIIPDVIQIVLLLCAILYGILQGRTLLSLPVNPALCVGLGYGLRWAFLRLKQKEALGWGDIKFFGVVGVFLSLEQLPLFFFIAGTIGTLYGIFWQIVFRSSRYPFGPALAFALWVLLLWDDLHLSVFAL